LNLAKLKNYWGHVVLVNIHQKVKIVEKMEVKIVEKVVAFRGVIHAKKAVMNALGGIVVEIWV